VSSTATTAQAQSEPVDFEDFVHRRRQSLLGAARTMCRDPHAAEDLLQGALERTYQAWPRIRDARAVDAYVRRVMYHQHIGAWRRSGRGAEFCAAEVWPVDTAEPARGPETDERMALWDMVCSLPARQRAAVVLRYYEDLSEAETARVLGCSLGTVKSNTSRGLATLRELAAVAAGKRRVA
jgi:RNA polymerase sigma-70 factor (sigma-E family)